MHRRIDNIIAQLMDLNKELENQYDILEALCSDYLAIYKVDFDTGTFGVHRVDRQLRPESSKISENFDNYDEAMQIYVSNFVKIEDRDYFIEAVKKDVVLEKFKTDRNYIVRYRVEKKPDSQEFFDVQFVDVSKSEDEHIAIVAFRNVDAIIRKENAFREETKQDLQETLSGSGLGIWSIEAEEGKLPKMSGDATFRRLLGVSDDISPEECYEWWYGRVVDDYKKHVRESVELMITEGSCEVNYEWNHPQLGNMYVRCGGIKDTKYNKKGYRIKGYHQDVTEISLSRQRHEQEMRESFKELQRANRAKTEFLSYMSHDIRTPINGILGMLVIAGKNPTDLELQKNCREKIGVAADHLMSLINDVLEFSKIQSTKMPIVQEAFNLNELLDNCLNILIPQAEEKAISIIKKTEKLKYTDLIGSPAHIQQILINITGNAIKYNYNNGKVYISIDEEFADEDYIICHIRIADNGIGMEPEFIKHIFEPFTQAKKDARTHYEGTGLGMAIVKETVDFLKGTIKVESTPGKGSVFTVSLPLMINKTVKAQDCIVAQNEEPQDVSGMNILLVEDNELNREITKYVLEDAGALVTDAENGQKALEEFSESQQYAFDCILMDIMMPVMNGIEAAKKIRSLNRDDAKTIPIIALSANTLLKDETNLDLSGINGYIEKPIYAKKLLATINSFCNMK